MGIFGSKKAGPRAGKDASVTAPQARGGGGGAPGAGLSIIGHGMTVRGDLETLGVVKVEGRVEGHVSAREQVLVSRGGLVHGDVASREVIVGGSVEGSIHTDERVEIQSGATVSGDITTRRIAVAEGGRINGQIRMGEAAVTSEPRAPGRSEGRAAPPAPGPTRPSVPVARVAVPPRAATPSGNSN